MRTITVSTRLEPEELRLLESLARDSGHDRATLMKSLLRRGMRELRIEQAVEAYRRQRATLSRAAEMAGVDTWEFLAGMEDRNLELHYDVEDFETDMAGAR